MGRSLESSRPILAPSLTVPAPQTISSQRASKRFSTYSMAPSVAISEGTINTTTSSNDSRHVEIRNLTEGFIRLESKRLQQQRYVPSTEKTESLSQLALQAKLERALRRRMTGQDAVLRPKIMSEKLVQIASA